MKYFVQVKVGGNWITVNTCPDLEVAITVAQTWSDHEVRIVCELVIVWTNKPRIKIVNER